MIKDATYFFVGAWLVVIEIVALFDSLIAAIYLLGQTFTSSIKLKGGG